MKTIALVDPFWFGHHSTYLKFFSKTLLELGHKVIVFCPEPEEITRWIAACNQDLLTCLQTFELNASSPSQFPIAHLRSTFTAISLWQSVANRLQVVSLKLEQFPDLTFFLWFDSYRGAYLAPTIVDRIFPYPWSGILFHPRCLRIGSKLKRIRSGFLDPLVILKSSFCVAVAVLDEGIAKKLQDRIPTKPVVAFPDFTDESVPDMNYKLVKEIQAKAAGRKIVGLLGSQHKRKGLFTLLRVAQKIDRGWFFVFAGNLPKGKLTNSQLNEIEAMVNAHPDRCFFHFDRIPTESQFNALVSTCDVLFAAYENFPHSSNMLAKAAAFQKPLVVSKGFCMGERVQAFNLGYVIDEGNVAQCIDILKRIRTLSATGNYDFQPKFEQYRQLHSVEQLLPALQKILDPILGNK